MELVLVLSVGIEDGRSGARGTAVLVGTANDRALELLTLSEGIVALGVLAEAADRDRPARQLEGE